MNNAQESGTPRELKDDWDMHWSDYAKVAEINPSQRYRHRVIAEILQEEAPASNFKFMDFGCGTGDLMVRIAPMFPNADLCGIDMSEKGCQIARRKVSRATFIASDFFSPSPELANYVQWANVATCSEVIEHVDDPSKFLREASKYLAPGAKIVITVPGGPMSAYEHYIGHRQHFTKEKIKKVIEDSGLRSITIYTAGMPFFNLYRLVVVARGESLIEDVKETNNSMWKSFAVFAMKVFDLLFKFNSRSLPFGWQIVAIAQK